jgi:hypothetical protein
MSTESLEGSVKAGVSVPILNPTQSMLVSGIQQLHDDLVGLRDTMERLEREAPGLLKLATTATITNQRYRAISLILAVSAAGAHSLRVGTANVFTVQTSAADTLILPLPVTIDRGKEILIVSAGFVDAFLVVYTDDTPGG